MKRVAFCLWLRGNLFRQRWAITNGGDGRWDAARLEAILARTNYAVASGLVTDTWKTILARGIVENSGHATQVGLMERAFLVVSGTDLDDPAMSSRHDAALKAMATNVAEAHLDLLKVAGALLGNSSAADLHKADGMLRSVVDQYYLRMQQNGSGNGKGYGAANVVPLVAVPTS